MKTCPWCEGKGTTFRMAFGEGQTVTVLGKTVPLARMVAQACGICNGTGEVSDERHEQLTDPERGLGGTSGLPDV